MVVVDAQIHLFGGDKALERARRIGQAVLDADAVVAAMDAVHVNRAYLVPAGSGANQVCLKAARERPDRFRVMGIPALDKQETHDAMLHWKSVGYIGARVGFPPFRNPSWLDDGTADWFWPLAEELEIPVMIWAPERLHKVAAIADRCPGLKLIIDHLGLFVDDKGSERVGSVVDTLLPLASRSNIAVKASALSSHSAKAYPHPDLHEPLRRVIDGFGSTRVFWGSDMTRHPDGYADAVAMFPESLDFLSGEDIEQIMGKAITQWIGW